MTALTGQLDYQSSRRRGRRRVAAALLFCSIVVASVAATLIWHGQAYRDFEIWREQRRCLSYTGTPDGVPSGAPACWQFFRSGQRGDPPLVFLHERMSLSGKRRLVVVQLGWAVYQDGQLPDPASPSRCYVYSIWIGVFDVRPPWKSAGRKDGLFRMEGPAGSFPPGFEVGAGTKARLFNGEPDPADPSHFTIGYSVDDRRGTINGWLRDNEDVDLKVRDSPTGH